MKKEKLYTRKELIEISTRHSIDTYFRGLKTGEKYGNAFGIWTGAGICLISFLIFSAINPKIIDTFFIRIVVLGYLLLLIDVMLFRCIRSLRS